MRGVLPINSSAVRCRPNSWTSSAPKLDAPTSDTQTGRLPAVAISASFAGHSSIIHRFQSSGNPCTATTSSRSNTPLPVRLAMNSGSIGEMPPKTRGRPGTSAAMASAANRVIVAKRSQSGPSVS